MEIKVMETKNYILYREKSENRDIIINESKKTGERYSRDTKKFIELAENSINDIKNCINEVKKYD